MGADERGFLSALSAKSAVSLLQTSLSKRHPLLGLGGAARVPWVAGGTGNQQGYVPGRRWRSRSEELPDGESGRDEMPVDPEGEHRSNDREEKSRGMEHGAVFGRRKDSGDQSAHDGTNDAEPRGQQEAHVHAHKMRSN